MGSAGKSPWIIHYDGSSCNGCDIEVLALLTPLYDAERFGVVNTGDPKHADVFLITGGINEQNIEVVRQTYEQMLEPKVVVACGICACTGGLFRECYNIMGGVDQAIPVDVYAPGCAVRPETIIDALVQGVALLDAKRAAMKRGEDPEEATASLRQLPTVEQMMHWNDPDNPEAGEIDLGATPAMIPELAPAGAKVAEKLASQLAQDSTGDETASPDAQPAASEQPGKAA